MMTVVWRMSVVMNFMFTVAGKPTFDSTPMTEVYNWAGNTRNLTCVAKAAHLPDWTWWHNGGKVNANDTFKIFYDGLRSSLAVTVKDVDEYWIFNNYYCNATNKKGSTAHIINMKQASVPGPPQNVQVIKSETPTVVPITVKKPRIDGGVKIIGYRLEYDQTIIDTNLVDTIVVENLKPSTQYFFRVRARNAVGLGSAAVLLHLTKSIRKPYPIRIVSDTESPSPYAYVARWEKPMTGGLPIQFYTFRTRKMHKDKNEPLEDWTEKEVAVDTAKPMLSYNLKNLNANTRYQLVILARNDMGRSNEQENNFYFFTAEVSGSFGSISTTREPVTVPGEGSVTNIPTTQQEQLLLQLQIQLQNMEQNKIREERKRIELENEGEKIKQQKNAA